MFFDYYFFEIDLVLRLICVLGREGLMRREDIDNIDLLFYCFLRIEYVVGGRKVFFNISYDYGKF